MKKQYIYTACVAIAATLLASCQPEPISEDNVFLTEDAVSKLVNADGGKLYTINEFMDAYMTEEGNYKSKESLYRTRATKGDGVYLFSIDTLPTNGPSIYIRGRVTTDDYGGNFYKSICIQQMVNGQQQALRISVDGSSCSGMYPLGQEILIRANGLAIGRYSDQPQLCIPTFSNNNTAMNADQKCGWAPGRIPWARFQAAVTRIGTPDKSKLYYEELHIADFVNLTGEDVFRKWDGKLVRVKNVYFNGKYNSGQDAAISASTCTTGNPEDDQNCNVFAPTTDNIGFPQSRIITDGTNMTLVSCSEYAKFAYYYLPGADKDGVSMCEEWTGDVTGILSFYRDNAAKPNSYSNGQPLQSKWAITLRDLSDIDFKNGAGNSWYPDFCFEYQVN